MQPMDKKDLTGRIERSEYLIDRFLVTFQVGIEWHCVCAEFHLTGACRHCREAAGMRAAQAAITARVATNRSYFPPQ
jgi:hypothetical protein